MLKAAGSASGIVSIGTTLTNTGGVLNTSQPVNAQTGTSYTIQTTDAGTIIPFNNASAVAVTLPVATTTGYSAGFSFTAKNKGAGIVTITPTTSTIGSKTALVLYAGESAQITSDGANYAVSLSTDGLRASGTFATRPTAGTAGRQYYCTDLNITIVDTGTKWKPLGGVAVIYQSGVQTTMATGDTAEHNVAAISIPLGIPSATGGLRLTSQMVKTGANATCTWKKYFSTTSGSGGTNFNSITSSAATKLSHSQIVTIWNRNSQSSQVMTSLATDGTGESTATSLTTSIDFSSQQYLNLDATPGNASDTVGYDGTILEWLEM